MTTVCGGPQGFASASGFQKMRPFVFGCFAHWACITSSVENVIGLPPSIRHVPPFALTSPNETVHYGSWTSTLAAASLVWPGLSPGSTAPASFFVLSPLITPAEAGDIRRIVEALEFDFDPDSVDGMATHEFYLEASGGTDSLKRINGKPDSDRGIFLSRARARAALAELTGPIVSERVLPFVNSRYSAACGSSGCRVCQSLVRRYIPGERSTHGTHFDIQALVTVVVSLSSFGSDFEGGLYVTTGAAAASGETAFLGLQVRSHLRCLFLVPNSVPSP